MKPQGGEVEAVRPRGILREKERGPEKSRTQLAKAAAVTGLAGAATGFAALATIVPVLGHVLLRTTGGATARYLGGVLKKRSALRDQATAGTFLLDMPVVRDTYNGRTVLEGMLLPQGLEGADMEHVALMEFPDALSAAAFLNLPEMTELQKATVEVFETMQLQPRRTWGLRLAALKMLIRRRLFRETSVPLPLRGFSKGWNRILAQQVAQQPAASLAALHFISLGSMDSQRARHAAAEALCEIWRCGGRMQYIASNEREAGCVELLVTHWRSPGQLLRYLRTQAQALDADAGEDDLADRKSVV